MPIQNIPFTRFSDTVSSHPRLLVKIINSDTNLSMFTFGIIDTGADECAVPEFIATTIGHNLKKGKKKLIGTAGGLTPSYSHKTRVELYHPVTGKHMYTLNETPIDYVDGLHCALLGVKNFLDQFVLRIDYPKKRFSITFPKKK